MVLTNFLPGQGNGAYQFFMYARDPEGASTLLGTRTIVCDNAHDTKPFGTIDTPGQGETVSGSAVLNFGWALTQSPKEIPADGSTLSVYVDGVALGHPLYGNYRSDIATLFPGLANSSGAVGYMALNTLPLANGLHTIVWTATDSGGHTEGLGSRYFIVSNGSSATKTVAAATATAAPPTVASLMSVPIDTAGVTGRRGWADDAPWREYAASEDGVVIMRGEEVDRLELMLADPGSGRYTGYQRIAGRLAPLPAGARVEPGGHVAWAPGVGFVGAYDLVFVRWDGAEPVARTELRVILQPKQIGPIGPRGGDRHPGAPGAGRRGVRNRRVGGGPRVRRGQRHGAGSRLGLSGGRRATELPRSRVDRARPTRRCRRVWRPVRQQRLRAHAARPRGWCIRPRGVRLEPDAGRLRARGCRARNGPVIPRQREWLASVPEPGRRPGTPRGALMSAISQRRATPPRPGIV